MNIEEFLQNLDYLNNPIIQNKKYPKDVEYFMKYKSLKYVEKKHIQGDLNQNNYVLYRKKDSETIYCLGIDQELEYIEKLDYSLKLPVKNKIYITDSIIEGIELFDNLAYINNNFQIPFILGDNARLIQRFLVNNDELSNFEKDLLLLPFDGNPIKKDIYIHQFIYFIKKYLEFRLQGDSDTLTRVPKSTFECSLNNALNRYIESEKESFFYQIIIKKLIEK